jgi:hypothetical protein
MIIIKYSDQKPCDQLNLATAIISVFLHYAYFVYRIIRYTTHLEF